MLQRSSKALGVVAPFAWMAVVALPSCTPESCTPESCTPEPSPSPPTQASSQKTGQDFVVRLQASSPAKPKETTEADRLFLEQLNGKVSAKKRPKSPKGAAAAGKKYGPPPVSNEGRKSDQRQVADALAALGLSGPNGSVSNAFGSAGLGTVQDNALGGFRGGGGMSSRGLGGVGTVARGTGGASFGGERGLFGRREASTHLSSGGHFRDEGVSPLTLTRDVAVSTFAADVDTGSYDFGRGFLQRGQRPPASSVRVEEWVNAFDYKDAPPSSSSRMPLRVHLEMGPSPTTPGRHLLRIGVKGKVVSREARPAAHLVFLVDTSGSMGTADKLPLAQTSLHLLTDALRDDDTVSIITYAGSSLEVLPVTSGKKKKAIHAAIDALRSGGGTRLGSAMERAYRNAGKHLGDNRISRIIVLSDGDVNIGRTSHESIHDAVKGYVSEGITLSTVGFGRGNYNDTLMEQLADTGNGNYAYIDSQKAAKKLFVDELSSTLMVIAKDVKLQAAFNPTRVKSFRRLGYENRSMAAKDFRNDKKDAGEVGPGHSVTALYELELHDGVQQGAEDMVEVRVRHKTPRGHAATEFSTSLLPQHVKRSWSALSADTRWGAAVALTAEILRGSSFAKHKKLSDALVLAEGAAGHRAERRAFVRHLRKLVNQERADGRVLSSSTPHP